MAARKKSTKAASKKRTVVRKKTTVAKKTHSYDAGSYQSFSPALVLGLVSVVMATLSLFGYHGRVALIAMVLGSVTVWLSLREQKYIHTMKGLTAIAISLATIYGLAIYTMDDISIIYGPLL